jgi:predicted enzyme related to lactoylglutathione lyase
MSEQANERGTVGESVRTPIRLGTIALDTPDPRGLASFYAELLGWTVDEDSSDDEWVNVRGEDGGVKLSFQLAPDLQRPTWPDGPVPQQAHLDLYVTSYDEPEARALALGATLLDASEEHADFRVYADPSGHPFCLCLEDAA